MANQVDVLCLEQRLLELCKSHGLQGFRDVDAVDVLALLPLSGNCRFLVRRLCESLIGVRATIFSTIVAVALWAAISGKGKIGLTVLCLTDCVNTVIVDPSRIQLPKVVTFMSIYLPACLIRQRKTGSPGSFSLMLVDLLSNWFDSWSHLHIRQELSRILSH